MIQQNGPSLKANESISAYRVVAVNASTTVSDIRCELADTSTSMPLGIIQDNVSTDGSACVVMGGVARAQCGASVSSGALLTWQADTGKVIEAAASSATITTRLIGISLHAGSTDSVILVNVAPQYVPNI